MCDVIIKYEFGSFINKFNRRVIGFYKKKEKKNILNLNFFIRRIFFEMVKLGL